MILSSTSFERSLTITELLEIKLSLNKLGYFDNIEYYTLNSIYEMVKVYENYINKNDGTDISFPGYFLGKDAKVKAKHAKDEARKRSKKRK
jgi:hypothetical protein